MKQKGTKKSREVITKDVYEPEVDLPTGTPSNIIRKYLKDGIPFPDDFLVNEIEFQIRVYKYNAQNKKVYVAGKVFDNIETVKDEIGSQCGSGRYDLFVNFKTEDMEKSKLLTALDIPITADFQDSPGHSLEQAPPAGIIDDQALLETRQPGALEEQNEEQGFSSPLDDPLVKFMLNQQQQMAQMQQENNRMVLEMMKEIIQSKSEVTASVAPEGNQSTMLQAIQLGVEMGRNGGEPQSLFEKMATILAPLAPQMIDAVKNRIVPGVQNPPSQAPPELAALTQIKTALSKPENADIAKRYTEALVELQQREEKKSKPVEQAVVVQPTNNHQEEIEQ